MLASIVSVFLFMEFWQLMFGHTMKGGLRMDLSCITGTFSTGQRMLSYRKWSCIKEEEIVRSLFLHAIKFYFQHPIYKTLFMKLQLPNPLPFQEPVSLRSHHCSPTVGLRSHCWSPPVGLRSYCCPYPVGLRSHRD
jgi:hypothetical protein